MNRIFTAKHSQIFATFFGLCFLQGMSNELNEFLGAFFYLIFILCYVGWLLLLGNRLRKVSPNPSMNYKLFVFVGVTLISVIVIFRLLDLFMPGSLKVFENTAALLSMMAYVLASFIVLTSFVGKNLKTIEVAGEIDINDYFGDMLGLIFWPIGIWTFQPRINKLAARLAKGE